MALATTCPQCKTSFRVVPDQLKLRRGFVRCGHCRHVFAGIDWLRYVDDAQLRVDERVAGHAALDDAPDDAHATHEPATPREAQRIPAQAECEDPPSDALAAADAVADDETPRDPGRAPSAGPAIEDESEAAGDADDTPLASLPAQSDIEVEWVTVTAPPIDAPGPTNVPLDAPDALDPRERRDTSEVLAPAPEPAPEPEAPRRTAPALEASSPPRWPDDEPDRAAAPDADESAIDYFSTRRRGLGFADRQGALAGIAAAVLAATLALQWIVVQRSEIAASVPALAPLLAGALAPFGWRLEPPRQLDALTIESFELHASAVPDVLEMRALLRNRAQHPVRWPSMQLTLTDPSSRVLVRRVLDPDDYLRESPTKRDEGVPAQVEWPLRLALEARDLQLAGYEYQVRLFYP